MAQVDSEWYGTWEYEHWSASKPSAFIGATWDIGAGRPHKKSGLFVGFRAHFADFGRVYDEDFAPSRPALGTNAGTPQWAPLRSCASATARGSSRTR